MSPTSTPARQGSMITTSGVPSFATSVTCSIESASLISTWSNACSRTARTPARTTGCSSTIRQRGGCFAPAYLENTKRPQSGVPNAEDSLLRTRQAPQDLLGNGTGHAHARGCGGGGAAEHAGDGVAGRLARRRARGRAPDFSRAPVAARCGGAPAPAAVRPGLALAAGFARARGFDARGAFAAGLPPASALAAALLAAPAGLPPESLFSLRLPGREWGRFPSTPSSSAMVGDSSRGRPGYMEPVSALDTVGWEPTG